MHDPPDACEAGVSGRGRDETWLRRGGIDARWQSTALALGATPAGRIMRAAIGITQPAWCMYLVQSTRQPAGGPRAPNGHGHGHSTSNSSSKQHWQAASSTLGWAWAARWGSIQAPVVGVGGGDHRAPSTAGGAPWPAPRGKPEAWTAPAWFHGLGERRRARRDGSQCCDGRQRPAAPSSAELEDGISTANAHHLGRPSVCPRDTETRRRCPASPASRHRGHRFEAHRCPSPRAAASCHNAQRRIIGWLARADGSAVPRTCLTSISCPLRESTSTCFRPWLA